MVKKNMQQDMNKKRIKAYFWKMGEKRIKIKSN